ncbi:hypothetical protein PMI15_02080 [Polaromonas sp. CF318]|uniref:hemagglutinin repeat-containing protein n=1 Tax=Polaromonas sp. CF318 TaxID=1144318 RepID=UPI000271179F|nr:hemagglutinin repeat-containing protein [Polaromonas sp. CF318]EJL84601.1 hypothetical protein PMI15_02080 [Polaromonas sp. CF318]
MNLGTITQSSSVDAKRDERNFSRNSQSQDIGSQVNATGNVTVTAGRDINAKAATNLNGAVVSGNQVRADLGGNLNIASQQDTRTYTSQQSRVRMLFRWGGLLVPRVRPKSKLLFDPGQIKLLRPTHFNK